MGHIERFLQVPGSSEICEVVGFGGLVGVFRSRASRVSRVESSQTCGAKIRVMSVRTPKKERRCARTSVSLNLHRS